MHYGQRQGGRDKRKRLPGWLLNGKHGSRSASG
jgi:hypothetical protein